MANDAGRVRESLQSAIDQSLVRPAPARRDDRYVAETVHSPSGRHRRQRLQSGRSKQEVARPLRAQRGHPVSYR